MSPNSRGVFILRWLLAPAVFALASTPVSANQQSDCNSGIAMIKSELNKEHAPAVLERLRKALDGAENEAAESDWGECMDHVAAARKVLRTKR
jgi:hypothetical protein